MLLHDSRRDARLDEAGDLVLLEEQDRRRWNQEQIAEALPLVEEALRGGAGLSLCRRRLPPCIARRRGPRTRTGLRSSGSTICSNASALAHRVAEPGRGCGDGGGASSGPRAD